MSDKDKLSTEELLACFDGMCQFLAIHHITELDPRAIAIRKLIQDAEVKDDEAAE